MTQTEFVAFLKKNGFEIDGESMKKVMDKCEFWIYVGSRVYPYWLMVLYKGESMDDEEDRITEFRVNPSTFEDDIRRINDYYLSL